ncbi:MAG: flagellin [Flavobacteriales bacterium]|jgi:flagellin
MLAVTSIGSVVLAMSINSVGSVGSSFSAIAQSSAGIQRSSERISSGSQINSAADNAAGLAISNRFSSQINEQSQSRQNANDGISFLQVKEGGLDSITSSLERLRELSLQAANGTLNNSDRKALDQEAQQLKDEIGRTVESTSFNGRSVLNDSDSVSIQLGSGAEDSIELESQNFTENLDDLNFDDLDISTAEGAQSALGLVDTLQSQVNDAAASTGAELNRLDSSISSLFNSEVNAVESRSRIQDADLAKEISDLSANTIKEKAAIALQAQANEQGKNVLRLLGFN